MSRGIKQNTHTMKKLWNSPIKSGEKVCSLVSSTTFCREGLNHTILSAAAIENEKKNMV